MADGLKNGGDGTISSRDVQMGSKTFFFFAAEARSLLVNEKGSFEPTYATNSLKVALSFNVLSFALESVYDGKVGKVLGGLIPCSSHETSMDWSPGRLVVP